MLMMIGMFAYFRNVAELNWSLLMNKGNGRKSPSLRDLGSGMRSSIKPKDPTSSTTVLVGDPGSVSFAVLSSTEYRVHRVYQMVSMF